MSTSIQTPRKKRKSFSRRTFVQAGAIGLSGIALAKEAMGQPAGSHQPPVGLPDGGDDSGRVQPLGVTQNYPLINRMTYGTTASDVALFKKLGWDGFVEYHLAPENILDPDLDKRLQEFSTINCTPYQGVKIYTWQNGFDIYTELAAAQLVRNTYAKAQFLEVMTEFWLDHFNININKVWSAFVPTYINSIRKVALTNFKTILYTVAQTAAMLQYLDNVLNVTGYHNENYARELMELHTLGVYAGYTETDIYTVRRCFTGWNFRGFYNWPWWETTDTKFGTFQFYADITKHDNEGGQFLGKTIKKGGIDQGQNILNTLVAHPSTATYISRKLCVRLLGEDVSDSFVKSVADVFTSSAGDMKTILRFILKQDNFTANYQPKFKRPLNLLVSGMRTTNSQIVDAFNVHWWMMWQMRQQLFQWVPPDGYPDKAEKWMDNLLPRWNMMSGLAQNNWWGVRSNPFLNLSKRTPDAVVSYINTYLFAGGLSDATKAALKGYMRSDGIPVSSYQAREVIGLALASPEFSWY